MTQILKKIEEFTKWSSINLPIYLWVKVVGGGVHGLGFLWFQFFQKPDSYFLNQITTQLLSRFHAISFFFKFFFI